jgi:hypothetical protein
MNKGKFVFSQVLSIVNRYEFQKCVNRYNGDYRTRGLNCWNQFVQLFFGQITARNGLRDICTCLNAHKNNLYHLGIKQSVNQSTLSRANENRDWHIFADFGTYLINLVRPLYADNKILDIEIDKDVMGAFRKCCKYPSMGGHMRISNRSTFKTSNSEFIFSI